MRISDWSSDVCSSDLGDVERPVELVRDPVGAGEVPARPPWDHGDLDVVAAGDPVRDLVDRAVAADHDEERRDRKSVVQGKSVSVRVDLGGRRIIKKKKIMMKGIEGE